MMALWDQLHAFMKSQMSGADYDQYALDVESGAAKDEDLSIIVGGRPTRVSLSMLSSVSTSASLKLQEEEKKNMIDVEEQRQEVRAAKYKLFVGGLERDQAKIARIEELPRQAQVLQHKKNVTARSSQAENGQKATVGYCNKHVRVVYLSKMELLQAQIQTMRSQIVSWPVA